MIDHITEWSEIMQYNNKCAITITIFVQTTLFKRRPWPTEMMCDQVLESIFHELRK